MELFEEAAVLEHLARYAADHGAPLPPGAVPARIARSTWDELMPRVPAEPMWGLFEWLAKHHGPGAPVRAATFPLERSVTCVFTLCASQRTLGGAVEQVLRFSPAFTNFFTWERHDLGDRVVLVPAAPPATRPGHGLTLDWHAVDLLNTGRQLAPFDGELDLVSPLDAATVRFLSGALHGEVRAGQPRTQVSIPRAHLDAAITHHVPDAVARVARWAAEGALADRRADETMSRRVLTAIDARLGGGDTGVESIARSLALSRRTLARRLAEEDTRFETLLDEARRSRAAALLHQQRLTDAEIASALGLSERSYFRNVRRWFGATPAALRST